MKPIQIRQGDVYLNPVAALPGGCKPIEPENGTRFVLAHGEVTGHAHAIYEFTPDQRAEQDLARAAQARPWESVKVFDTMVQWAGVGNRISLDKLCNALGLPRKGGITGSDVWPMVQAGRIKDVADYCIQDVIKTRMAHQRMTFRIVMQPEFEDVAA